MIVFAKPSAARNSALSMLLLPSGSKTGQIASIVPRISTTFAGVDCRLSVLRSARTTSSFLRAPAARMTADNKTRAAARAMGVRGGGVAVSMAVCVAVLVFFLLMGLNLIRKAWMG